MYDYNADGTAEHNEKAQTGSDLPKNTAANHPDHAADVPLPQAEPFCRKIPVHILKHSGVSTVFLIFTHQTHDGGRQRDKQQSGRSHISSGNDNRQNTCGC